MTLEEIKKSLINEIDNSKDEIIAIGKTIAENPEVGYCEEDTSRIVREQFDNLKIGYDYPLAVTGIKGKLKGNQSKINVCVIGELDAVRCDGVPAHKCGHHTQIAAMLGVAKALKNSGVMEYLDGDVIFMATPAEEFIDLDLRKDLKKKGKISYFGGKQQLICENAFDDIVYGKEITGSSDMTLSKKTSQDGVRNKIRHNLACS